MDIPNVSVLRLVLSFIGAFIFSIAIAFALRWGLKKFFKGIGSHLRNLIIFVVMYGLAIVRLIQNPSLVDYSEVTWLVSGLLVLLSLEIYEYRIKKSH